MIAIVDYGVGNLFSIQSSFSAIGLEAEVTGDAARLAAADKIILPGVGAFGDAMDKLRASGLAQPMKAEAEKGKPLLGICLGMQLLFEESYEFGNHTGLGLIKGRVCAMEPDLREAGFDYKVPHIGWNPLGIVKEDCPLLRYTKEGESVYYVHSFYAKDCEPATVAVSEYGLPVVGVVQNGNVFGTQFHPEKSGEVGLSILKAFGEMKIC